MSLCDTDRRACCIAFCLALQQLFTAEKRGCLDLALLADSVRDISQETADAILAVFDLEADQIPSTGCCLDTLQAALWPVDRALSLEEGIITIVNLGYDADTCGAVAGALLGARDGAGMIPERWIETLQEAKRIKQAATGLYEKTLAENTETD